MGVLAVALSAGVYLASFYPTLHEERINNQRALSEIKCDASTCDSSAFSTDPQGEPDYIIDGKTKFFLNFTPSSNENPQRFPAFDVFDTAFFEKFRQPASYRTLDLETWRLYSQQAAVGRRIMEITVGYAMKAPYKMFDTPPSVIHQVDAKLKADADRIADNLQRNIKVGSPQRLSADGFVVTYSDTGQVVYRGLWLPAFIPQGRPLPKPGTRLYVDPSSELYIVRTDADTGNRLLSTSIIHVGSLRWLAILAALIFLFASLTARWLARRFLRNYFALSSAALPDIHEALLQGEGQRIEFKRAFPLEEMRTDSAATELLKSIAAFGNTNDGAIFVGVDDHGIIKGLQLNHKGRDSFERRIRSIARNHIRPTPPIEITFEEPRGLVVARIAVAHGMVLAHLLNGVIYVRNGSSDVQAQPEDLNKLVAEYAL